MGVRGIVRDVVGILLGFEIIAGSLGGHFSIDAKVLIEAVILFVFGIWFLLERVGILPKV